MLCQIIKINWISCEYSSLKICFGKKRSLFSSVPINQTWRGLKITSIRPWWFRIAKHSLVSKTDNSGCNSTNCPSHSRTSICSPWPSVHSKRYLSTILCCWETVRSTYSCWSSYYPISNNSFVKPFRPTATALGHLAIYSTYLCSSRIKKASWTSTKHIISKVVIQLWANQ